MSPLVKGSLFRKTDMAAGGEAGREVVRECWALQAGPLEDQDESSK